MARSEDILTPMGRFAFVDGLFKPRESTLTGRKAWQCSLLFPKETDLKMLRDLVVETAQEEWGDKALQMLRDDLIKNPFLDGDGKQGKNKQTGEPHKGFPGTTFIRLQSGEEYRPQLINRRMLPVTSREEFYSGVWGQAVINAFTWENEKNGKGVSWGISMAQAIRDDEKLGGGGAGRPEDWFHKIDDDGSDAPADAKSRGAASIFD